MLKSTVVFFHTLALVGLSISAIVKLPDKNRPSCDELYVALKRYFEASARHPMVNYDDSRQKEYENWGVDIADKADLRRFSCQLVGARSLKDLASIRKKTLKDTKDFYENFFIVGRSLLEDGQQILASIPDEQTRSLFALSLKVLSILDKMGLYDLDTKL